jgi:hypothetical protein
MLPDIPSGLAISGICKTMMTSRTDGPFDSMLGLLPWDEEKMRCLLLFGDVIRWPVSYKQAYEAATTL